MKNPEKESPTIKKYRKKLESQLEEEHKQINAKSLDMAKRAIKESLVRHSEGRIQLKDKLFVLFDENQHPATPRSKFVLEKIRELKSESSEKKFNATQL